MPRINNSLAGAWDRHSIRTAGNMSPIQLWTTGMLQNYHSEHLPVNETFTDDPLDSDSYSHSSSNSSETAGFL